MYKVAGQTFQTPESAISAQEKLLFKRQHLLEQKLLRNPIKKKSKRKSRQPREVSTPLSDEALETRIESFYKMAGKIRGGSSPLAAIEEMHTTVPEWKPDRPENQEESLKKLQSKLLGAKYIKHRDISLQKDPFKRGILAQRWQYLEQQEHERGRREKEKEEEEERLAYQEGPEPSKVNIASHKYNIWFINGPYLHPYLQEDGLHLGAETFDKAIILTEEAKKELLEGQVAIVIPQEVIQKQYNLWKYAGECLIPYLYATQDGELKHLGTHHLEKSEEIKNYLQSQGEQVLVIPQTSEYGPNGELLWSLKPDLW